MVIQPDFLPKRKVGFTIDFRGMRNHKINAVGVNSFEREVPIVHAKGNFFCQNKLLKHSSKMRPIVLIGPF
jgi:hypothetical protein